MSKIISTTETVHSADFVSNWYGADGRHTDTTKLQASNSVTPREIIVQVGLQDIVGSPDASSKIQIFSTVQGQAETLEYEQAITADNMNDAFLFDGIKANAVQVKGLKGGMTSFKLAVDYDAIY